MPPGDRQRSVRSDRSVMLGVLCTVCSLVWVACRMHVDRGGGRRRRRKFNMHRRTFVSRLEWGPMKRRRNIRRNLRWHRFVVARRNLRLSPEETKRACIIYFLGYSINHERGNDDPPREKGLGRGYSRGCRVAAIEIIGILSLFLTRLPCYATSCTHFEQSRFSQMDDLHRDPIIYWRIN